LTAKDGAIRNTLSVTGKPMRTDQQHPTKKPGDAVSRQNFQAKSEKKKREEETYGLKKRNAGEKADTTQYKSKELVKRGKKIEGMG